jgi:hypothetical protein
VPVVELLQHGTMGKEKYYEWSLSGYLPFVELIHIPFLYLFKLKGFLFGFPFVVLPLCTLATFAFMHEVTGDKLAATFGAFAYVAMPMINEQPFSAYIDFAVSGLLAYFLYALLRLRTAERPRAYLQLGFATALFTLSRVQALYVVIVLFPILAYLVFIERHGFRLRINRPRALIFASAAVFAGAIPAIAIQIWKYLVFGTPSYPVRFEMFGIQIGSGGLPIDDYFRTAGIGGHDWGSVLKGAFDGWLWHGTWPVGAFFASSKMAAGLLGLGTLVALPFVARRLTRLEWWLLGGLVFVSLLSRDFGVPRWGYTVAVVIVIIVGKAVAALASSPRAHPVFWIAIVILFGHLLRPEFDYLQMRHHTIAPRINVTASSRFVNPTDGWNVEPFPDIHGKFEIIELTNNNFVLQIFGRRLGNQVIGTIAGGLIGARCENLADIVRREPKALFIDDRDFSKACQRECAIPWKGICRAYRIHPAATAVSTPGS